MGNTAEVEKTGDILTAIVMSLADLPRVEEQVRKTFQSDSELMREIPNYLLGLGGKRIRPVLTLLCAEALGLTRANDRLIEIASGIELIHMATLMHDDIIDHSPLRRHKPSPLAKFGMASTLLSGDFLLVRAFGLCSRLEREIIEATETACIELVEGESLEVPLYEKRHTLESSLNIAKKKTASLFRLGAFSAARIAGVSPEVVTSMASFGERLGIAFQVLDDILDVTADEQTLGKKSGLDITERKPSIINVMWLDSGSESARKLLSPPDAKENEYVKATLKELRGSKIIQDATVLARKYADEALGALGFVAKHHPQCNLSRIEDLKSIVEFTLARLG